ncbi:chitin deacetylase [Aspergillus alliaceus]|uniref:Chitin deacetylase n=1 Tax=Petromyces alliaceus TaxID=209559 RepID=A0A5N6GAL2_PETAA|nr:uncharacterized protein BDW43DRAFT_305262 [Aspergillus alliaceus]KAB8239482.1 hypothetical protein BDW43DRAFT_305262 [Aspergillus alliaceus]KAF5859238.1 chitin deacetylase [Aspergillus burnettii]
MPAADSAKSGTANVATGQVITKCTRPGTVALTFDDGPSVYTNQLLDLLNEYGARSTFFMIGDGSQAYPDVIQRMRREGHQVASHTYDHPSLPSLSYDQTVQQMTRLEAVLQPAMGDIPTYMRPPYFDINDQVLGVMRDLGYKVITSSIDTKDYENNDHTRIDHSYEKFVNELNAGGSIVLAHDIHEQTVVNLARRMLEEIKARGLKMTTVGDCLGEPAEAWYRAGR